MAKSKTTDEQPEEPAAEGPETRRSAATLEEALAIDGARAEAAGAEAEDTAVTARQEAAQAELDAQQADRDAGYATSAEEGPTTPKPPDSEAESEASEPL
jgi:hypothetical protein